MKKLTVFQLVQSIALAAIFSVGAAAAKAEAPASLSQMVWVDDHFELLHYLPVAEATEVLAAINPEAALETQEGLALLAVYVEDNFSVTTKGQPAQIETISAEVDDQFVYIYQSWATDLPKAAPVIASTLLEDVAPDAEHFIDVASPILTTTESLKPASSSSARRATQSVDI